jgi:ferredoxin-nitrite reductase
LVTVMLTEEQKLYLEGFIRGVSARQGGVPTGLPPEVAAAIGTSVASASSGPETQHPLHQLAQDRVLAAGQKLVAEEEAKRRKNPFDMWDEMRANAETGKFPKGSDIFLQKFHGLFYVAPAQNSFMCRLRMPNGIVSSHQMRGLADLAVACGGGYSDVTTRANLQIREITAQNAPTLLMGIQELGLTSRGAGADNIRNITGGPTAGIDAQEIIDTRPLCRQMHHYILNHREMYGLPRKFNIAFDGGGLVSVLEDTNDISFAAVAIPEGQAVPAGVYFRMALGGITGHGDFARDTGIILRPEQCVPVAAAVVRVFIEHGDRTDRKKARLKYVLEKFGLEKYMEETEKLLGYSLPRLPIETGAKRGPRLKHGHVGVHKQKQAGLNYIGVVLPVGRLKADQMRALADITERFGSATIRLTVWQNLLISDVPDAALEHAKRAIEAAGLGWSASSIRSAMVACTGNTGCKFSASDTKGHASAIAQHLESRLALDTPINIHLTGCPHSCAQHFIADIGMLGTKVGEDAIEGYHINVGGSAGATQEIAREIYRDVPATIVPVVLERMLSAYLAQRRGPEESFQDFTRRHSIEELRGLFGAVPAQAAA